MKAVQFIGAGFGSSLIVILRLTGLLDLGTSSGAQRNPPQPQIEFCLQEFTPVAASEGLIGAGEHLELEPGA